MYLGVFDRVTFREARCRVPRIQSTVLCCCRRSNELTDVVLCLATGLIPRRIVSSITAGPHEGEVAGRVRGYVICMCVLDAIQSTAELLGQADWGLGSIWVPWLGCGGEWPAKRGWVILRTTVMIHHTHPPAYVCAQPTFVTMVMSTTFDAYPSQLGSASSHSRRALS